MSIVFDGRGADASAHTRKRAKAHPSLTLRQAAAVLGMVEGAPHRRLFARLRSAEIRSGRKIMRRWAGEGRGVRYAVTIPLLRRHCPELFATVGDLPNAIAEAFGEVNDRVLDIKRQQNAHGSVIREHSHRILAIERLPLRRVP